MTLVVAREDSAIGERVDILEDTGPYSSENGLVTTHDYSWC